MKGKKPQRSKLRKAFIAAVAAVGMAVTGTVGTLSPKNPVGDTTTIAGLDTGYNLSLTDQYWKSTLADKSDEAVQKEFLAAAGKGDSWRVQAILDRGLVTDEDADLFSEVFETAGIYNQGIALAARGGHFDVMVTAIFNPAYNDYLVPNFNDGAALQDAVRNNHYGATILMVVIGSDLNAQGGKALSAAVQNNNTVMAQLLLDNGADINANDGAALRYAGATGNVDMIALLQGYGADIQSPAGAGALVGAIKNGHDMAAFYLIGNGADTSISNNLPLRLAEQGGSLGLIAVLENTASPASENPAPSAPENNNPPPSPKGPLIR